MERTWKVVDRWTVKGNPKYLYRWEIVGPTLPYGIHNVFVDASPARGLVRFLNKLKGGKS